MSQSVFASFDPLATHPFTNNSGLLPKPAAPSKYPLPIPSSAKAASSPSAPMKSNIVPLHAPQPQQRSPVKASTTKAPIFVPFRPERSSPDLDDILLKKKVSDAFANKQTWSIDQAPFSPRAPASKAKAAN